MKEQWISEFDRIDRALIAADPLGLIASGAPDDEYELEALEIFLRKKKNTLNEKNAEAQMNEIFRDSVGETIKLSEEGTTRLIESIM